MTFVKIHLSLKVTLVWAFRRRTSAMSLQAHLVHTLATRSSSFEMLPVEIPVGQDSFHQNKVLTSSVYVASPKLDVFSKDPVNPVCSGTCRQIVLRAGDAENLFTSCVERGEALSPSVRIRVSSHNSLVKRVQNAKYLFLLFFLQQHSRLQVKTPAKTA